MLKSIRMKMAGHVARIEIRSSVYVGLMGKHEGKEQLGKPRRRWENIIKMGLQGV